MAASTKIGDLGPAVDLILQPLLLEVLVATDEGKAMEDALPADADSVVLDAALARLVSIGAIRLSASGPLDRHELTTRGRSLLKLIEALDAVIPAKSGGAQTKQAMVNLVNPLTP